MDRPRYAPAVHIELTDEQAELLRELLAGDLSELRMEISHTDNARYRMGLRDREVVLRSLLDLLGGPLAAER